MCESCEALTVNGVLCHEVGCPDAWMGEVRTCFECGCDFRAEERYQRCCWDCLRAEDHADDHVCDDDCRSYGCPR